MLEQVPMTLTPSGPKQRQQTRLRNQHILTRYQEGWSQVAIALEFGISQSRVSQILELSRYKRAQHQWARQVDFTGTTLRNARSDAGMTRKDLACQLGVSEVAVGNWERGKQSIPARRVEQLHSLLKHYLLNTEDAAATIERHVA